MRKYEIINRRQSNDEIIDENSDWWYWDDYYYCDDYNSNDYFYNVDYDYIEVEVENDIFNIISYYNDRYILDHESNRIFTYKWVTRYFSRILNPENFNIKKSNSCRLIDNNSFYSLDKKRDLLIDSILSFKDDPEKDPIISNFCKNWKVLKD